MPRRKILSNQLIVLIILLLVVAWAITSLPAASPQVSVSGWLHVIWGDPSPADHYRRELSYNRTELTGAS